MTNLYIQFQGLKYHLLKNKTWLVYSRVRSSQQLPHCGFWVSITSWTNTIMVQDCENQQLRLLLNTPSVF